MNRSDEPALSQDEADALDFLMAAQFDPAAIERLPEHLRASARRMLADLGTIDQYPLSPPSESLVDATLARVAQEERLTAQRMSIASRPTSLRMRLGIPNLVAIAAMLIVAAGVAVPLSNQVRQSQSQLMCASGMRSLGSGLSAYAADNSGVLPMTAGLGSFLTSPSATDDGVAGGILENAKHLEMLSKAGYCDHKCTRCNGARNLSYRVPLHPSQANLATMSRSPLAADANPVQLLVSRGIPLRTFNISSENHGQRGQNVLFSDGSAVWLSSPLVPIGPGPVIDNIWVFRSIAGVDSTNLRVRVVSLSEIFLSN